MDQDTDLFVQAFWVKSREIIRPEIDAAIGDLRSAGHDANVSTQEFSTAADGLPAHAGPSVTLTLRPAGAPAGSPHPWIEFHGDVAQQAVEVLTSDGHGHKHRYELAMLGTTEVKVEIDEWLARLVITAPI